MLAVRPLTTLLVILDALFLGLLIFDIGFPKGWMQEFVEIGYVVLFGFLAYRRFSHPYEGWKKIRFSTWLVGFCLAIIAFALLINIWYFNLWYILQRLKPMFIAILMFVLVEHATIKSGLLYGKRLNPAFVFSMSFFAVIAVGSALLMLPSATTKAITLTDAIFTATSAVSVTGLAVVDTATAYTRFGQWIIMILIQLGGLGVLTITAFFAYFFKNKASIQESIFVKDFVSSDRLNDTFVMVIRIVYITLFVETMGAILIYYYTPASMFNNEGDRWFFAFFHAVSGFCNAGFSTLSNSVYDDRIRFDYPLHLTIAFLFIIGGLGYGILSNVFASVKQKAHDMFTVFRNTRSVVRKRSGRVVTLNTILILYTTFGLIVGGTILLYFTEFNNTLLEHETWWGKMVTAFFMAVSPRTAGFNNVDMGTLMTPTILLMIFLMWIGASPASTGGGIKTSTFALALLNIRAVSMGKAKIEIGTRTIARSSVNRAFAIVAISLLVVGAAILLIASFDPQADLLKIGFECFSAYSTVGLSLNFTSSLSTESRWVLILVMFFGRVGTLNLLIGILQKTDMRTYKFPEENIMIN